MNAAKISVILKCDQQTVLFVAFIWRRAHSLPDDRLLASLMDITNAKDKAKLLNTETHPQILLIEAYVTKKLPITHLFYSMSFGKAGYGVNFSKVRCFLLVDCMRPSERTIFLCSY